MLCIATLTGLQINVPSSYTFLCFLPFQGRETSTKAQTPENEFAWCCWAVHRLSNQNRLWFFIEYNIIYYNMKLWKQNSLARGNKQTPPRAVRSKSYMDRDGRQLQSSPGSWDGYPPWNEKKFAPENRPGPKRKRESLPTIHFLGAIYVSFREGNQTLQIVNLYIYQLPYELVQDFCISIKFEIPPIKLTRGSCKPLN